VSPVSAVVEQVQSDARQGAAHARDAASRTEDAECAVALEDCAEALDDCADGATKIARSCWAEIATAERHAWNRGFLWGLGGTLFGLLLAAGVGSVLLITRQ